MSNEGRNRPPDPTGGRDSNEASDPAAAPRTGKRPTLKELSQATLQPRVRPVGERTSATALFDFSARTRDEGRNPAAAERGSPFFVTPVSIPATPTVPPSVAAPEPPEPPLFPSSAAPLPAPAAPQQLEPILSEDAQKTAQQGHRTALWLLLPVSCLLAGVAWWGYENHQAKMQTIEIKTLLEGLRDDRAEHYLRARTKLKELHLRKTSAETWSALALVEAHLHRLGMSSEADARRISRHAPAHPTTKVAMALLPGPPPGEVAPSDDWHVRLLAMRSSISLGHPHEVEQRLRQELRRKRPAAAVFYAGIRYLRRAGIPTAGDYARAAEDRFAEHPGLRIEATLLDASASPRPLELNRHDNRRAQYRADLALAKAHRLMLAAKHTDALALLEKARREHPGSSDLTWAQGRQLLAPKGNVVQALALLRRAADEILSRRPQDALLLAEAEILCGRPAEALPELDRIEPPKAPDGFEATRSALRVRALAALRRWRELRRLCGKAFAAASVGDSATGTALTQFRVNCVEAISLSGASVRKAWVRAIRSTVERSYVKALVAATRGSAERVVAWLEPIRGRTTWLRGRPHLMLARAYDRQNDVTRRLLSLNAAVAADARSVTSLLARAQALHETGHAWQASLAVKRLPAEQISSPSDLLHVAALAVDVGNREVFERAAQASAKPPDAKRSTLLTRLRGRIMIRDGKLLPAKRLLQRTLARAPKEVAIRLELCPIFAKRGRRRRAMRCLRRAIAAQQGQPETADLWLSAAAVAVALEEYRFALQLGHKGVTLARARGNGPLARALVGLGHLMSGKNSWASERAEQLFLEAAKLTHDAQANLALARLSAGAADMPTATKRYLQAIAHDPALAVAHRELALTLAKSGQALKARRALKAYLRLRPDAEDGQQIRDLIDSNPQ